MGLRTKARKEVQKNLLQPCLLLFSIFNLARFAGFWSKTMKKIEVLKEMKKNNIFSNRAYVCPKKVSELKFKKLNPSCKSDLAKHLKGKGAIKVCVLQTYCKTTKNGYQYTPIACIYQDGKQFDWFTDVVPSASLSNLTK